MPTAIMLVSIAIVASLAIGAALAPAAERHQRTFFTVTGVAWLASMAAIVIGAYR